MADDFAGVEFLFTQQDLQEGGLSGAVASDKTDLGVIGNGGFSVV